MLWVRSPVWFYKIVGTFIVKLAFKGQSNTTYVDREKLGKH